MTPEQFERTIQSIHARYPVITWPDMKMLKALYARRDAVIPVIRRMSLAELREISEVTVFAKLPDYVHRALFVEMLIRLENGNKTAEGYATACSSPFAGKKR